ncbi:DNA-binding protein [Actinoplanes utahensis]|nr:DNA-binding protein [Actinoplanes utahensis]
MRIASDTMRTGRLMGAAEIARRLGMGRTRAKVYMNRPDWPDPLDELEMGRIYWAADIEVWIAQHRPDLLPDAEDG